MAIIISKDGKNAVKLNKTEFDYEDNLQQYIHNNPESIPLYDIKDDIQLLILTREFQTASGPIDAVGIDKEGDIYLVETKLYKNPDKRTVVAQVLDYGASLWKSNINFDSFLNLINESVQKNFGQTLKEKMQNYFSIEPEEVDSILLNIATNLNDGNYKFVVLMDNIHDQLKDLILFINQNSKFDIYGVELEYYKYNEFEIVIPKLFGAEVKKDIKSRKVENEFIPNEEFIKLYKTNGLEKNIIEILNLYQSIQNAEIEFNGWDTNRTPKNINFFYRSPGRINKSLNLGINYNKTFPAEFLYFWLYEKEIETKVLKSLSKNLGIKTWPLKADAKYGIVGEWKLKDFDKDKLMKVFSDIS